VMFHELTSRDAYRGMPRVHRGARSRNELTQLARHGMHSSCMKHPRERRHVTTGRCKDPRRKLKEYPSLTLLILPTDVTEARTEIRGTAADGRRLIEGKWSRIKECQFKSSQFEILGRCPAVLPFRRLDGKQWIRSPCRIQEASL
jgi:hypothetical protein